MTRFQESIRLHLTGEWEPSQVHSTWVESSHRVPDEARELIEQAWRAAGARPDVKLFDGAMCRLEAWRVGAVDAPCGYTFPLGGPACGARGARSGQCAANAPQAAPLNGEERAPSNRASDREAASGGTRDSAQGFLQLALSRTSYKLFVGTNMSHPELADHFGRQVLANPVGVSPALETADGFLMLGRRNGRVAYYPNRVHPFAGCLEPVEGGTGSGVTGPDVFAAVRRELFEELGLGEAEVPVVRCTGIAEDVQLRQPELIFRARTTLTRSQIESQVARDEHHASWSVPATPEAVTASLADPQLTPVAIASLLLWGRIVFGAEWFASQTQT